MSIETFHCRIWDKQYEVSIKETRNNDSAVKITDLTDIMDIISEYQNRLI